MVMIEFIHPSLMNYRLELFEKLHKKYNIKFIFVMHDPRKEFGGINIPSGWNSENIFLKGFLTSSSIYRKGSLINYLHFIKRLLTDDYGLMITGPLEMPYSLVSIVISKLRSRKVIVWGEGWYWPEDISYRRLYLYNKIIKSVLRKVDAVIATGKKSQEFYKKILGREDVFYATKYVVPFTKKDPANLLKNLKQKDPEIDGKKIVLFVGRIIRLKGVDYLIKAFKLLEENLDDVYLLIVGDGPFKEQCEILSKNLKIKKLMFTGYISDEDSLELYYNLGYVLVLPSITLEGNAEANGYVVYESMGIGKPVVVTDAVGATPEYVQDNVNGFVVQEKNVEELYEALLKILNNEKLAKEMGEKSKEIYAEKICLKKQFDSFQKVIEHVKKNE